MSVLNVRHNLYPADPCSGQSRNLRQALVFYICNQQGTPAPDGTGVPPSPPGNAVICLSHSRECGEEVEKGAAALRESPAPPRALYPSSLVTVRCDETLNVSRKGARVLAPFASSASIDLFVRCDEKGTKMKSCF